MSLKRSMMSGVRVIGRLPPLSWILFHPKLRRNLQLLPGLHIIYGRGWELLHPFDTLNGTETSGYISSEKLLDSPFPGAKLQPYAGSQPSIVRTALGELPPLSNFTFIDLGAGKGRPVMVASEFAFKEAIGVELSSALFDLARINLATFRRQHPGCAHSRMENVDAAAFPFPAGDLVIFFYNSLGRDVMKRVIANIEAALNSETRSLFVIYYNPIFGECFDDSPLFRRYYAATVPYAAAERGFGPDDADPIVIWQGGSTLSAKTGADAAIRIINPDRSELVI